MKISVVIPQLFYDAIARVIPGALALGLIETYHISNIGIFPADQATDLGIFVVLGRGIEFLVTSYVFGWILGGLTWPSQEPKYVTDEAANETGSESDSESLPLRSQYQWIRLAHQEAGFRIVKLRAEARMLEGLRTALSLSTVFGTFLLAAEYNGLNVLALDVSAPRLAGLVFASLLGAIVIYARLEAKAWDNYKGNIGRIYRLLHDKKNPIPMPSFSQWPPNS